MQCDGRLIGAGGCKGKTTPPVGIGGLELGGFVKDGKCLSISELANEVLTVADEQSRVCRTFCKQTNVEVVGANGISSIGQHFS